MLTILKSRKFLVLLVLAFVLSVYPTAFAQGPEPEPDPVPLAEPPEDPAKAPDLQVPDEALRSTLAAKDQSQVYIVLMRQEPVIAYEGNVAGLQATKPSGGQKVNPNSTQVQMYNKYLEGMHDAALKSVGADRSNMLYSYTFALNGFAAKLTDSQVAALTAQPDVLMVLRDQMRFAQTDNTPDFLELTAKDGPWAQGFTGEGVVVGIIDTGIWPEHPSFADDGTYPPPPVTLVDSPGNPSCNFGNTAHNPLDVPFTCNNKLIGARQFLTAYKTFIGLTPREYDSARDDNGHGTHTASTSAGNSGVEASIFGINRGTISGIAPRAHVIAYKGLGEQGGFSSDLAAAIDQAVADGVDVINYSIGSSATSLGADDIAFLFAADAGVFVATSAGNSGPGPATIGSPAWVPWLTSVGASTHDRMHISEIELDGPGEPPEDLWGASVTDGIDDFNLVDAEGIADSVGDTSGQCLNPFPPGTFQPNDAVLCNRYNFGVARIQRVMNVRDGGGGAVIFHNSPMVSVLPTDNHVLPTVHVHFDVGEPLKYYLIAHPGQVKVSFTRSEAVLADADHHGHDVDRNDDDDDDERRIIPNSMASFSSRGPNGGAMDIIKPDVTAPGVNILAGNTPTPDLGAPGQLFQSIMGTSMSSPHVAGVFALIKQAHPEWTPAMAKSALMTTARQNVTKEDGATPADPFDIGAGHIRPGGKWKKGSLVEPGLVYDAGLFEYAAFTCGADLGLFTPGSCAFLESIGIPTDASDLNLSSIGVAQLVGGQTVIRTVTSVAEKYQNFKVSVDAPAGFDVTVTPDKLKLDPGETASYVVTISNNGSAVIGDWAFGSLTWKSGKYEVYSPMAVRAFEIGAPTEVSGAGTSGSLSFDTKFGYNGAYSAGTHGLAPADMQPDTVVDDPANDINIALATGVGVTFHFFNVPAGSQYARFSLFDDYTGGNDDLDLYVFGPSGFVGGSGSPTSTEQVDVPQPEPGTYIIVVHGWQTDRPDSDYTLFNWAFDPDLGNMTVTAPTAATLGATETITVDWAGLAAGTKYMGAVSHNSASGLLGLTLVRIDTD
ncbi:MAG: S8 family serine peptidase [Anaerolineae bacterium]